MEKGGGRGGMLLMGHKIVQNIILLRIDRAVHVSVHFKAVINIISSTLCRRC